MKKIIAISVIIFCMLSSFAMDLEKTYGLFKVELNEKTGTFSISVLDTSTEKYIPVISRTDSSSNTKLYVLSGSTVYPLNLRYGVSVATEISDLYTRMEYTVPKKFSLNLYFSFYPSEPDGVFDVMQVDAVIKNISDAVKNFSFKIVFDTILGESTKTHFSSLDKMSISNEHSFPSMQLDKWIRSSDGSHAIQFLLYGADIIEPWKAVVANRDILLTSTWNPSYKDGRGFNSFYTFNDSALLIQNDGMLIAPEEEHDMRFYITAGSENKNPADENCSFFKAKKFTEDGSLRSFVSFVPPVLKESEFTEEDLLQLEKSENSEILENAEDKNADEGLLVRSGEDTHEKPVNSKKAKKAAEKAAKEKAAEKAAKEKAKAEAKKAKKEAKKAKQKEREEKLKNYNDDDSETIEKTDENEVAEEIRDTSPEEKAKKKQEEEQRKQEEKEAKKKAKEEKEAKKKADEQAKANEKALEKAKDKAAKKAEAEEKARQKAIEKAKAKSEKKEKAAQKKLAKAEKDKAAKEKAAKDKAAKELAKKQEEDAKKAFQPVKVEQKKKTEDDDVELAGPTVLYSEQVELPPEPVSEPPVVKEEPKEQQKPEEKPAEEEYFENALPKIEEVEVQDVLPEPPVEELELIEEPADNKQQSPREMTDEEYLLDLMNRLDELEKNPDKVNQYEIEKLNREVDLFLQYSNIKLDGAEL